MAAGWIGQAAEGQAITLMSSLDPGGRFRYNIAVARCRGPDLNQIRSRRGSDGQPYRRPRSRLEIGPAWLATLLFPGRLPRHLAGLGLWISSLASFMLDSLGPPVGPGR
jgi:hypothetical protein